MWNDAAKVSLIRLAKLKKRERLKERNSCVGSHLGKLGVEGRVARSPSESYNLPNRLSPGVEIPNPFGSKK